MGVLGHSLVCRLFVCSLALSLHSLPRSWESEFFMSQNDLVLSHSAALDCGWRRTLYLVSQYCDQWIFQIPLTFVLGKVDERDDHFFCYWDECNVFSVIFSNKGSKPMPNLAKINSNEGKIHNAYGLHLYMRRKNMYQINLNGPPGALSPPWGRGVKKKVILRPILFDCKLFETYKYHSPKKSILKN